MVDKVLVPKLDILELDRVGEVRQYWRHLCSLCVCERELASKERKVGFGILDRNGSKVRI